MTSDILFNYIIVLNDICYANEIASTNWIENC